MDNSVQVKTKRYLYQFLATGGACIGAWGLGATLAYTSPAIPELERCQVFGNISEESKGLLAALVPLGAVASCPITAYLIGMIGRKTTMLLMSAPFILGWLLITHAKTLLMMKIGRFMTGVCSGAFSLLAPLYIAEISEPGIRGTLGTCFQIQVTFGILFTYVFGTFLTWQWLSLMCGVIPLTFLVLMIFMPESPQFFISQGQILEAKMSLKWLRGAKSFDEVEGEFETVRKTVERGKETSWNFSTLRKSSFLRPTALCTLLMFFQQFSGINYVIFFSKVIFDEAVDGISSDISVIIVGVVHFLFTVLTSFLIDRVGRRPLLLISSLFMTLSLSALGTFFYLKNNGSNDLLPSFTGWLSLGSLMTFIVSYSIGYGPIPWLLMSEFVPINMKGLSAGICTFFSWTFAFIITLLTDTVENLISIQWCYWGFAICCFIGTFFVYFHVPETKGKSLDEIKLMFDPNYMGNGSSISASVDLKEHC